ncbi:MAG: hypothetical protein H7A39_01490 [Chlamydiales bacterium]|nr:hypothetical protein [Chlamydiales bacterium]
MSEISGTEGVSGSNKAQLVQAAKKARLHNIVQKDTKALMREASIEKAADINARLKHFKELKERGQLKLQSPLKQAQETKAPPPTQQTETFAKAEALAKFYQKRNAEMEAKQLLGLHSEVQQATTTEETLDKIIKRFSDPSLADEAIDYLLESLHPSSDAYKRIRRAKDLIRSLRGREIIAGRNMGGVSRSHGDLASPSELRDLYRDITGNPREAQELFEELIQKYTYEKMKEAIEFILKALRADLTAKGSSISHGELHTLVSEAKNMQAILGVYNFFKSRGRIIRQQYEQNALPLNNHLHFETLSKLLVTLLKERYPSVDKILRLAGSLGITDDIMAQIIIFTQYRDAMRGIAPRLFKSEKHRQDMLMTTIEALAELEDALEEEDDDEEEEE